MKAFAQTLYRAARYLMRRPLQSNSSPLARPMPFGYLDSIEVEPCGLVRVLGWVLPEHKEAHPVLQLEVGITPVPLLECFRTFRQDVALLYSSGDPFLGRVWTFLLPGEAKNIHLAYDGQEIWRQAGEVPVVKPHYAALFNTPKVLRRDDIYSYGPPSDVVAYEVLALARRLPGNMLDFGCGAGALVDALRQEGREVQGIEIRRPEIERHLVEAARPHVTLYEGSLPLPFEDGQFTSVTAVEVIEHITAYEEAIAEIARICRKQCLITVPDMSAIPTLYPHGVVPWHLLEGTHYNFFNQASLEAALKPHFRRVDFARIGAHTVSGTRTYTSLAAVCSK